MKKLLIPFFLLLMTLIMSFTELNAQQDLTKYVNSFIGSTGPTDNDYGGTIPSVAPPFAMTQWCAMTRENYVSQNPYNYKDSTIIGFIGTHQPAIWMGDYGYVSILPSSGKVEIDKNKRALSFKHENETASPYFYSIKTETKNSKEITTEMTATTRCSMFNIKFPKGSENHIFIEASRKISPSKEFEGYLEINPDENEIVGYNSDRHSHTYGPDLPNFKGYFVLKFSKPFSTHGSWKENKKYNLKSKITGDHVGGYVYFDTQDGEEIQVKVATSFISIEQARMNMEMEIPNWDFQAALLSNKKEWQKHLNRVIVDGKDEDQKICFYTALYRSLQYPRIFSEYGKYYSAFDDKIHEGVSYNDYSLWDTFRALHPWLTIVAPEQVNPMIESLLNMYDEAGWMPKWPNPTFSNIMIGTHADAVIADAYVKGFRGYDVKKAYEAVYKNAMTPPTKDKQMRWGDRDTLTYYEARSGLSWYKELGYVPADKTAESVSRTLEFAYNDYCTAVLAKDLGTKSDYDLFMKRTKYYENVFNPKTGFMGARNSNGDFFGKIGTHIDPTNQVVEEGITEGGKWTYLFCALQDVNGLIELMGGNEKFNSMLDRNFDEGHFQHRNEPGHHHIYLYNYSGQPWKAQEKIWEHTPLNYQNAPDGLSGNDDCGQMSAWLIFSSMGFYPVCPGDGQYVIGSPLFPRITLNLPAPYNKQVTIIADGVSEGKKYIKSVKIDGRPINKPFITHEELVNCDNLIFEMSETPTNWGI